MADICEVEERDGVEYTIGGRHLECKHISLDSTSRSVLRDNRSTSMFIDSLCEDDTWYIVNASCFYNTCGYMIPDTMVDNLCQLVSGSKHLYGLVLRNSAMSPDNIQRIGQAICSSTFIRAISFKWQLHSDVEGYIGMISEIVKRMQLLTFVRILVDEPGMSGDDTDTLCNALECNSGVEVLCLEGTFVDMSRGRYTSGMKMLLERMRDNRLGCVRRLYLGLNAVQLGCTPDWFYPLLYDAINKNTTLYDLDLEYSLPSTVDVFDIIFRAIEGNMVLETVSISIESEGDAILDRIETRLKRSSLKCMNIIVLECGDAGVRSIRSLMQRMRVCVDYSYMYRKDIWGDIKCEPRLDLTRFM